VAAAEAVCARVRQTFFGPVRVSVMLDPSGANSTAGAAVVAAGRHLPLADPAAGVAAVVLGGTGPVGQRVARLLVRKGVAVTVASRSRARAAQVCTRIAAAVPGARLDPAEAGAAGAGLAALETADLIVAAGAEGVVLLDAAERSRARRAQVFIDLNAVPPAGIAGVGPGDKARPDGSALLYGALGVGGTKMKIHRAAIRRLFESTDAFLDAEELLAIGEGLERGATAG
jgi:hypothetical protein